MNASSQRLEVDGRLDLRLCLTSGQTFRWRELPDGSLRGVDAGRTATVTQESGALRVDSAEPSESWERFFRLETPSAVAERALLRAEPRLAAHREALGGLRPLRLGDPVETLFSFLCSVNNHLARIQGMVERLATYGDGARFPTLDRLAKLSEAELRGIGFGYRARTVPLAALAILDRGDDWLESLKAAPYRDAWRELQRLPGVGPKVADCVCLYGLHFDEAAPIDVHMLRACRALYPRLDAPQSLTLRAYESLGDELRDRFGPWTGWAQLWLYYGALLDSKSGRSM